MRMGDKTLYSLDVFQKLTAVEIEVAGDSLRKGSPRTLFHTGIRHLIQTDGYDVSRDGRLLVLNSITESTAGSYWSRTGHGAEVIVPLRDESLRPALGFGVAKNFPYDGQYGNYRQGNGSVLRSAFASVKGVAWDVLASVTTLFENIRGSDGTRTRGLLRDRQAF